MQGRKIRPCVGCLVLMMGLVSALPSRAVAVTDSTYTASSLRAALVYADGGTPVGGAVLVSSEGRSRSIPLAFGLSAVVPGLGQAYNRQWAKAAASLALEAAVLVGYTTWRTRGLDGEEAYQAYAHQYWNPMQYATWLNDYAMWLREDFSTPIDAPDIVIPEVLQQGTFDVTNPDGWTLDQRRGINQLFAQIRAMEDDVVHPETNASFSHKLPQFGEQQYYELIGKYFQFAPGWSDYPDWLDAEGEPIDALIDPERTGENGSKPNVSDRFFDYADDHGQANDYLRRASRVSILFVVNHLISAVDAAVFAKLHNNRLEPGVTLGYDGATGQAQPMARMRVRL